MGAQRRLSAEGLGFVRERHLATLSTVRTDGSLHVVAVGFTWHDGLVRIITSRGSQKVLNAVRDGRGAVGQVDGARWLSLSGAIAMRDEPDEVRLAEQLYAERYRTPRPNPERVVLVIEPDALLGSAGLVEPA